MSTRHVHIHDNKEALGSAAAEAAASAIQNAIAEKGEANIIVATGASQFAMLEELVTKDIDWSKVTAFHLDEYVGLSDQHPASFRKYLKERFVDQIDGLKQFNYVDAETDPEGECVRLGEIISKVEIDVACVGIGENGHLAFNDPPADFETETPYLVVDLDDACRQQQLGEGWFPTFDDVPKRAISMGIKQIMKTRTIVCSVPDERKSEAVRGSVEGEVSNLIPASILQQHADCALYLDAASASKLSEQAVVA
jgi:glucosamine-6-phosphate deaminase